MVQDVKRWMIGAGCVAALGIAVNFAAAETTVDPSAFPPRPTQSNWTPPAVATGGPSTVDLNGQSAASVVNELVGANVTVSNVSTSGANVAIGTFTGGNACFGIGDGIILSSGNIAAVGAATNTSDAITTINGEPGDPDLSALIPGFTTFDRAALEFDFECQGIQNVTFQYVFSSDEYNEYVNSSFNDVFGFFLDGVNIAEKPGAPGVAVSINNINCNNPYDPPTGANCALFLNNDCSDKPGGSFPCNKCEMDGQTIVLTASAAINPGAHHFKIAIADAGDPVLDSNVLIRGGSFTCGFPTVPTVSQWGLVAMTAVLVAIGLTYFGYRRKAATV